MLQKIIDDPTPPATGEEHLAALTAGDRIPWAKARQNHFAKGINKNSLDAIEKARNNRYDELLLMILLIISNDIVPAHYKLNHLFPNRRHLFLCWMKNLKQLTR